MTAQRRFGRPANEEAVPEPERQRESRRGREDHILRRALLGEAEPRADRGDQRRKRKTDPSQRPDDRGGERERTGDSRPSAGSVSELGHEGRRVHQKPDAEHAADADRRIEERRDPTLVRLPDKQPSAMTIASSSTASCDVRVERRVRAKSGPCGTCSRTGAKISGFIGGR